MDQQQPLEHVMQALQICIASFLEHLSIERDVLLHGQINRLPEITAEKQNTLNDLNTLENQIRPYIHTLEANILDDKQASQTTNSNVWLQETWKAVVESMRECQRINLENGALVNTLLKGTKNALHQLHSLTNSASTSLYNEAGNQQYHSIGKHSIQV
jgi:flagellar biosynthesis/type III secretory pathway chaperone